MLSPTLERHLSSIKSVNFWKINRNNFFPLPHETNSQTDKCKDKEFVETSLPPKQVDKCENEAASGASLNDSNPKKEAMSPLYDLENLNSSADSVNFWKNHSQYLFDPEQVTMSGKIENQNECEEVLNNDHKINPKEESLAPLFSLDNQNSSIESVYFLKSDSNNFSESVNKKRVYKPNLFRQNQ